MPFPLTLCTGILRSGSTWSFNVCRLMATAVAGRERKPIASSYLMVDQLDRFLQTNGGKVPGPTVLKAHGLGPIGLEMVRTGLAKAVCTYRDPRDCVASMITFAGYTFEQAAEAIALALTDLDRYGAAGNTLFVRYEDMITDRLAQVRRIADYLGVTLDSNLLARIDEMSSLEQSKRICEQLESRPQEQLYRSMDHRVDPQTWLHDNHIQSGKAGRWKDEISADQAQTLQNLYAPWLSRLGYETGSA
jgi:hypothetical protein